MDVRPHLHRRPTHGSILRGRRVIDAMPVELLRDRRGVYGIGGCGRARREAGRLQVRAHVLCSPSLSFFGRIVLNSYRRRRSLP